MNWIYNDGGRSLAGFKGSAGDCVTRAIAIVTEKPYKEVYDALNEISKKMGMWHKGSYERNAYGRKFVKKSSARTGVQRKVYEHYLLAYCGMRWIPLMEVGSGCKIHLREEDLPMGRLVCRCSSHLTAVIDRVIHDTYDPSREGTRCVYGYYTRRQEPPKKEAKPAEQYTKFNEPVQFNFFR